MKGAQESNVVASMAGEPSMPIIGGRTDKSATAGFSVVDDRLTIHGNLDTDGSVRVDGRVEGASHRAGTLIVGVGGTVVGNVEAREVVVAGSIDGNVHARGRIEIESGAAVHGDIRASSITLREGGAVDGQVSIGAEPPSASVPATPTGRRLELAATPPATSRQRG
jgi:cytoskeletal protein CcmA (bactofilin family)